MDYLYPEELTKIFMTCNLVGGFFQRIEKLRKYAFASICVFGEDNNNVISGIWVWRGQELVFPVSCLLVPCIIFLSVYFAVLSAATHQYVHI